MVYAKCNNEECEKDSWWLKKPPGEYASGGPKCPDCGTTRVEIDDVSSDAESAAESEPETRPATAQEGGGDAQGGSLDTQQDAIQAGAQVGNLVAGMGTSTPEEQAEAQGKLATALGSAVASVGQQMAEEKMENINRAKNADESNVAAVEDYVSCPECSMQITDLPPKGTKFRCPGCGQLLESQ